MKSKKSYTIGIHVGHDATACLLDYNGKIVAAIAEERLTRVKYHMGFPFQAIEKVVQIAKIEKKDITTVAIATKRLIFPKNEKYNRLFFLKDKEEIKRYDIFNNPNQLYGGRIKRVLNLINHYFSSNLSINEFNRKSEEMTLQMHKKVLKSIDFGHCDISIFDHHACHAASAFYCSGKEDGLIITMDGAGDGKCATASVIKDGKLQEISSSSSAVSIGRLYSEVTAFCGFKRLRHEGKITGLSAHGNPNLHYNKLKQFLNFNPVTEEFDYNKIEETKISSKLKTIKRILNNKFSDPKHSIDFLDFLENNFDPIKDKENLAASIQKITEDVAVEYVKHFLKKHKTENIMLAGGIFANVRVNQEIANISGVKSVYVHQNMGDGGLSVGASFLHYNSINNFKLYAPKNVYFGEEFSDAQIEEILIAKNIKFVKSLNVEKDIAELIHNGKVIGRFNDRMEYGPRALGNRSIIASPTDKRINDWLNKKLRRTEFMPFAPSVIEDQAHVVFEDYTNNPGNYTDEFMTITYNVKKEWTERTQATTHIDGTARPQIVKKSSNSSYYNIINEYYKLSGIPVIINTSFNMHEEPIVATPSDAIRAFNEGCIDYLAIGSYLCKYENKFKENL